MKHHYTHINFLLDRSGSMELIRSDTIGGINRYIDTQRQQPGTCTLTLAQFDDQYELIYERVPITDVAPRTTENYQPRGWTALHDAMARLIDDTGARLASLPESERPEHVIFVTMTDGQENSSRQFKAQDVRKKIEHQRTAYQWEFVFLGANQDAVLTAKDLGIHAGSTITYAANAAGVGAVMDSVGMHTNSYRASGRSVRFTRMDRAVQLKAGAQPDAANDPVFGEEQKQASTAGKK
jgi:hypothetical protein